MDAEVWMVADQTLQEIAAEHDAYHSAADALRDALAAPVPSYLSVALKFGQLVELIRTHLHHEEQQMRSEFYAENNPSAFQRHTQEHQYFFRKLNEIADSFVKATQASGYQGAAQQLFTLVDHLDQHMTTLDEQFAAYCKHESLA